jgi:predicted ester cyclase
MNRFALVAAVVVLVGCGKKKPQEGIEPSPPVAPVGSAAPAPKPLTGEELAKHFDDCWGMWNAGKYDDFKGCYAADASREVPGSGMPTAAGAAAVVESTKLLKTGMPDLKGEPMLELVDGQHLFAVVLVTGTHTGTLAGAAGPIAPTNKKVGFFVAQALELDDAGHARHEWDYFDLSTVIGQVSPNKAHPQRAAVDKLPMAKQVIVAKHDDKDKANVEAVKALAEAFSKHDAKAFAAHLADGAVWAEQSEPADETKATLVKDAQTTWKQFSDVSLTLTTTWSAGDYVVTIGSMDGTNDGPIPEFGIKTPTKKRVAVPFMGFYQVEGGLVKQTWIFDQGLSFATQLGIGVTPAPAKP